LALLLDRDRGAVTQAEPAPGEAAHTERLPQIPALTGLRFFAAFFILFAHAVDWLAQFSDSNIRSYFAQVAMYGIPLFFVLSGFVIHYNYRRLFVSRGIGRATCEFAAARFARLFPLYFCLLLMAIFADDFINKTRNLGDLWAEILVYYATLTQSWWYLVYYKQSIIYWLFSVSWSISTEMFFYAAYVAIVFVILLVVSARAAVITAVAFAIVVLSALIVSRVYLPEILNYAQAHVPNYMPFENFEHSFYRWLFYFSPYIRVFEFVMGCLAAHAFILLRRHKVTLYEQRWASVGLVAALALLVLAGVICLNWIKLGQGNSYVGHLALNFLCAPLLAFVMFYVGRYQTAFTAFMSLPILIVLGDASYSIYLIHTWTLRIFFHTASPLDWISAIDATGRVVFSILLTLAVAYATYRIIEVPSRAWLRQKLGKAIAAGFAGKFERPPRTQGQVAAIPVAPVSSARARVIFSAAACAGLALIVIGGQAARSEYVHDQVRGWWKGNASAITTVSATYGMNCRDFPVPAPFPNLVAEGNVTKAVQQACDAANQCRFRVDVAALGDPAPGCGKDFVVRYQCTQSDKVLSSVIGAEANGKTAILSCRAER
jgi:peptidoglycan/LPS O-acetylase OafA/YrhL